MPINNNLKAVSGGLVVLGRRRSKHTW